MYIRVFKKMNTNSITQHIANSTDMNENISVNIEIKFEIMNDN